MGWQTNPQIDHSTLSPIELSGPSSSEQPPPRYVQTERNLEVDFFRPGKNYWKHFLYTLITTITLLFIIFGLSGALIIKSSGPIGKNVTVTVTETTTLVSTKIGLTIAPGIKTTYSSPLIGTTSVISTINPVVASSSAAGPNLDLDKSVVRGRRSAEPTMATIYFLD